MNLWGVVHGIATFVPLLIEQGEGHVVNTASIAGLTTAPFLGPYNATKQAVVAISETLYKDLQAFGRLGSACRCSVPASCRPASPSPTATARLGARTARSKGPRRCAAPIQNMVDSGIPPAAVADACIDAVRTNTFYILTHPELDAAPSQTRFDDILEGRPPSPTIIA